MIIGKFLECLSPPPSSTTAQLSTTLPTSYEAAQNYSDYIVPFGDYKEARHCDCRCKCWHERKELPVIAWKCGWLFMIWKENSRLYVSRSSLIRYFSDYDIASVIRYYLLQKPVGVMLTEREVILHVAHTSSPL